MNETNRPTIKTLNLTEKVEITYTLTLNLENGGSNKEYRHDLPKFQINQIVCLKNDDTKTEYIVKGFCDEANRNADGELTEHPFYSYILKAKDNFNSPKIFVNESDLEVILLSEEDLTWF